MRIRRRTSFSSPSPSNPIHSPLADPSFNALPAALLRRDATKDAGAYSKQELHQQGDLPTGAAQGPNWSALRHQLPVHHLESHANSRGCSSGNSNGSFSFPHPADADGRIQMLSREELKREKEESDEEEEDVVTVDSNKRCDHAKVNSSENRTAFNGAGALILLEAAKRLEESAALAKEEANGNYDGDKGDGEFKIKGKTSKGRRRRPSSLTLNSGCTSDNNRRRVAAVGGAASAAAQTKDEDELLVVNGNSTANAASGGKKRRSPAVVMEGSRCSRVNGRGWRCCQQTLVGYSLCEHHLGKGRLRSMNSVRGQIGATTRPKRKPSEGDATRAATSLPSSAQDQEDKQHGQHQQQSPAAALAGVDKSAEEGADNNEDTIARKKRKRVGMVKARSISSLLDRGIVDPSDEPSEAAKMPLAHETMA